MAHHIEITQMDHQVPLLDQTSVNIEATQYKMQEGGKLDYLIEIKEINGEDRSGLQTNKSTKQIFDEKLKDLNNKYTKSCTIFRVTKGLSESNPDAYTPKLISIGPYHNKNFELHSMEKYKLMYLQRFLRRKEGVDVESCINELEQLKDEALKCYDDLEDHDSYSNGGQFLQMLLLDGCFMVEYIRECCGTIPTGEGRIIKRGSIDNQVRRDLLLLENQLPLFVLTKLYDMTKGVNEKSFTILMKCSFLRSLPKITPASFLENEGNEKNIKHLLHFVHMSCHPFEVKTNKIGNSSMWWSLLPKIRSKKEIPTNREHLTWHGIMPNATELSEAGVSFTKVGNIYSSLPKKDTYEDSTSLFDIKFENGLMEIPCFEVVDHTESLLRNLIAFEQQSPELVSKCFTDFSIFMDYLIDSNKDVNLLRQNGIISNRIGDDKEVASLFNKIGKGVAVSDDFYYKEVCIKLVQHCEKRWNRMMAKLRHNYFNSPWTGISTLAAIILLLLTATQTIVSFISIIK